MISLLLTTLLLAGGGPDTDAIYICDDSDIIRVQFEDDFVQLRQVRQSLILVRAVSGSGARYTDGKTLFWIKGQKATLDDGNGQIVKCRIMDRG